MSQRKRETEREKQCAVEGQKEVTWRSMSKREDTEPPGVCDSIINSWLSCNHDNRVLVNNLKEKIHNLLINLIIKFFEFFELIILKLIENYKWTSITGQVCLDQNKPSLFKN